MRGYLNNRQATEMTIDPDGWLHTGDIGHADEDDYFYVVDRLKELIKCKGYQVPPAELEAVLLSHPAVQQAYVVGVADRARGEVGVAAVELRPGASATAEALTAFCRERLASYKVPARIVFRTAEQFPRTATGKVQKPRLREELER